MGSAASTLFARLLTLILFLLPLLCLYGQSGSKVQAGVKNYVLPQYREKDGRLQYIIYGDRAENSGALMYLDGAKIDILQDFADNLEKAKIFLPSRGEKVPAPYSIQGKMEGRKNFWNMPKQKPVRAWIFTDRAVYDKNTGILRSDGPANFRSREIDVDGVGFDAYTKKKFIHIRSKVRVVIHPEIRKKVSREKGKTSKQEKK